MLLDKAIQVLFLLV